LAAICVIPARYSSTRFPGKIVASATGKPLVQHVVERARGAKCLRDVIVATDDQRIVEALRPFGTRCVMTSPKHASGTDRIAEVARAGEFVGADENIVNVQGDEPEIEAETIDLLVERLEDGAEMATAATEFAAGVDPGNPNLVKVVVSLEGKALYFSRAVIPFVRDPQEAPHPNPLPEYRERGKEEYRGRGKEEGAARESGELKVESRVGGGKEGAEGIRPTYYLHQGIYAYRREFLLELASWPPTPLEKLEKLEQLRVLEHGRSIDVVITRRAVNGIDTPEQYEEFVRRYKAVASFA
jgi:3-deoxy-manno-octulosonate cytidylyltransferase (CMP-KDO synthetase)